MVGLAAIGIVLFNWSFHAVWGAELFLYAGHWLVPAILLMSGVFCFDKIRPLFINMAMTGMIVAILSMNALNISYILTTLENVSS